MSEETRYTCDNCGKKSFSFEGWRSRRIAIGLNIGDEYDLVCLDYCSEDCEIRHTPFKDNPYNKA